MQQPPPTDALPAPLLPLEEHNRRLRDHVHPPGWTNPEPPDRYDLVVLGGGTAGLVATAIAAGLGARVALVERDLLGGDCLNAGCVPSKALLRAARAWAEARGAAGAFGGPAVSGPGDFGAAMQRMRRIRADIAAHDSAERFRGLGADVYLGAGRFTGADRLEVGGRVLRFRRAMLATGARPATPPIPGLAEAGFLTHETVFSLTALPRAMVVIGGGPIGCELAQAFARFGSRVSLVESGASLLPHDDRDAAEVVRGALERDGVRVLTGATVERVDGGAEGRHVRLGGPDGTVLECDEVLVATGRAPAVEGIGLEAAGVRASSDRVETDARLRTSNARIYAIGDVNGRFPFTHAADAEARLAVQNALFFGRKSVDDLVVPWCTYTSPEVAQVGEVREPTDDTITIPLDQMDRARLDGATDGFLRVHLASGSDHIVGATLVAEHAGEIIGHFAAAMAAGLGLDALGSTIFPYPTVAEVIRRAADARRRERLTPLVKRGFDLFFRVTR